MRFCLKYGGKLQPENNHADVKVRIQLDSKKGVSPRAFFSKKDLVSLHVGGLFSTPVTVKDKKRGVKVDPSAVSREQPDIIEQTITLTKGREFCEAHDIYVPDTIRDKISPIVISLNYTYIERRAGGGQLEPAIDTTLPTTFDSEVPTLGWRLQ